MSNSTCEKHEEGAHVDLRLLDPVLRKHADDVGGLIAVLQETQDLFGYLPKEALRMVSSARQVPLAHVYGVATFYSQFHLRPRGDKVIRICHGTACHVRGAPEVTRAVSEEIGVKVGETTEKLDFTLESVACVGCCGLAPVMLVGDATYGQLDAVSARTIAATLREEAAMARGESVGGTEDASGDEEAKGE